MNTRKIAIVALIGAAALLLMIPSKDKVDFNQPIKDLYHSYQVDLQYEKFNDARAKLEKIIEIGAPNEPITKNAKSALNDFDAVIKKAKEDNRNIKLAQKLYDDYLNNFRDGKFIEAKEKLNKILEIAPPDDRTAKNAKSELQNFDKMAEQRQKQLSDWAAIGQELMESYNTVLSRNTSNRFFNYADYDPKYTGEYYNVRVYVNQYFQSESQFYEYVALCQRTWYMMAGARKEKLVDYNPDFINIDFFDAASGEKIYTWNKNVRQPL